MCSDFFILNLVSIRVVDVVDPEDRINDHFKSDDHKEQICVEDEGRICQSRQEKIKEQYPFKSLIGLALDYLAESDDEGGKDRRDKIFSLLH
jgi:hypothetical protein